NRYFLPFQILSRMFRGKFLAGLRTAFTLGRLHFPAGLDLQSATAEFEHLVSWSVQTDWVAYVKPPIGGPEVVLKYLARYTHRVPITMPRLLDLERGMARFRYKDSARRNRQRVMTLPALEFVRRLLLHVLPSGFVRIRHYGILSNRHRHEKLGLCHQLLGSGPAAELESPETIQLPESPSPVAATRDCPVCS